MWGFFIHMHYVYIIYSTSHQVYYKGETSDILSRLDAHNHDFSEYTKKKGPWKLVFVEQHPDRSSALKREKQIKRLNARSLVRLLESNSNLVTKFIP